MIKDVYPSKCQYFIGEEIEIIVELDESTFNDNDYIVCDIFRLHEKLLTFRKGTLTCNNILRIRFKINVENEKLCGFGVIVSLYKNGKKICTKTTAFDIVKEWYMAPRYGFLCDFSENEEEDTADIMNLNKFHINAVQFYDWMYRHHELFPKEDYYIDPLGRQLSLRTVKNKIECAHLYGMKVFAYGAVYGAEKEFFDKHKNWALYKNDGDVFNLINLIYIMDISNECEWRDHIISEFFKAIEFGFDGIHMDQYGFPKEAQSIVNGIKKVRKLRDEFPSLINDTREYIEKKGYKPALIFNAVNNWPVDKVAGAKQDVVYIEVWPPNDTYQDLYNLVTNAKKYAPDKQVILAAYMKPFSKNLNLPVQYAENATIMTMATIFACGGFHLLLGELNGILTEAYYPNYTVISSEKFIKELRDYYDFIVRYEELLYDFDIVDNTMTHTGGINDEYVFKGAKFSPKAEKDCVWTLVKEKIGYKIIHLINFTGIQNMNWNEGKESRPQTIKNIEVTVVTAEEIEDIYLASPDINSGSPCKLEYEYVSHEKGKAVKFIVPVLNNWDMVYLVLKKT